MSRPLKNGMAHVDIALEQWASWGKQGVGIGWPPMTLLAKVIEQGFAGAAQPGPVPEMSELVQAVERAVLRLDARERKVLTKYYVHWQPIEVSARYCKMSPANFRTVLHRARRDVGTYLEHVYAHWTCNNS